MLAKIMFCDLFLAVTRFRWAYIWAWAHFIKVDFNHFFRLIYASFYQLCTLVNKLGNLFKIYTIGYLMLFLYVRNPLKQVLICLFFAKFTHQLRNIFVELKSYNVLNHTFP